jgi:hypothetical protein
MTSETGFDSTVRLLTESLNTELPTDVGTRMRERLKALESRLELSAVMPARRNSRPRFWPLGATALASVSAVAVLLTITLLGLGASPALARISDAVAAKTWLHAVGTGPDGQLAEMWFSAKEGILAGRQGDSFVFVDQSQETMDVFGKPAASDSVTRTSLKQVSSTGIRAARQSFAALLGGDIRRAVTSGSRSVMEHSVTSLQVEGRELLEHRFVVGGKGRQEPRVVSVLQVEPATGLPISWQMKMDDRPICDYKVSYPEHGPLTIFGMGVPETAQVIDTAPAGQFRQVLLANQAARRRFDDYHAIIVEGGRPAFDKGWVLVYRVWRKGGRWRIDQCRANLDLREVSNDANELKTWWLEQSRSMPGFAREIWDGQRLWTFNPEYQLPQQPDPAAPKFLLINSLTATSREVEDRNDPQSVYLTSLPEFYGYEHLGRVPSFGVRAETRTVVRDELPLTQVEILNTWNSDPDSASPRRFWFDPQRSKMIVRKEHFRLSQPDVPIEASEVLSAEKTPQGLWYPTCVRLIDNSVSREDNSRSDSFIRYFLEFDTAIPDDLFQADAVNLKNVWTHANPD